MMMVSLICIAIGTIAIIFVPPLRTTAPILLILGGIPLADWARKRFFKWKQSN